MDRPTESIIRDILIREMILNDQNIWISSQNFTIENDQELYLIVGMVDAVPLGNNNYVDFNQDPPVEVKQLNIRENIQVEILSKSDDAFIRRWEVVSAIGSLYSRQVQEENNFKIGKISTSFANTSATEGSDQINRFSIVIPCNVWYSNTRELASDEYFETFPARIDTEETIGQTEGLIEIPNLADEPDVD